MARLVLILALMSATTFGVLTSAAASGPEFVQAARRAYENGNYGLAIDSYTQAIQSGELSSATLAAAFRDRGIANYIQSDSQPATEDFTAALHLNPSDAPIWYFRAIVYWLQHKYDLAISDYTEALRLNPGYIDAWNERGVAYHDMGQYDLAISDFNEALRLDPNHQNARNNRDKVRRL